MWIGSVRLLRNRVVMAPEIGIAGCVSARGHVRHLAAPKGRRIKAQGGALGWPIDATRPYRGRINPGAHLAVRANHTSAVCDVLVSPLQGWDSDRGRPQVAPWAVICRLSEARDPLAALTASRRTMISSHRSAAGRFWR